MGGQDDPERALLSAALLGAPQAAADLTRVVGDVAWTACLRLARPRAETEAAFREVMAAIRADGFARLKAYDGRARVRIYVALVVRDLLAERVVRGIALDGDRGWRAFQAFFDDDMRRIIARLLPGAQHHQNREDAYQAVCEALVVNDLQRLRAYSGRGSAAGYVLHVIENLAIDHVRTIIPRRRLPAAVQRLPELDQAVFRLLYWEQLPADPPLLIGRLPRGDGAADLAEVAAAVARVRRAVPMGYQAERSAATQMVDISTAEQAGPAAGAEDLAAATPRRPTDGAARKAAAGKGARGPASGIAPSHRD